MPATNLPATRSVNVSDYTPYIANPDGVDGSIHSNDPSAVNNNTLGTGASVKLFNIALTTAGRFSFYIDYSELATTGTHTFYVQRTHGTVGAVSVNYATSGDAHTTTSGTLSWADGQAGVQSFEAVVPTKADAGDHRIVATLSAPSGGAVLHHGAKTVAYGVIDDGTIALDADAVFADFAAGTNGTGTQASPYNNPYDAIANVGTKRYIYMRGTHIPDGTNTATIGGAFNCIAPPSTRTSEATRVFIQAWPGFTCTIDGTAQTNCNGFYTAGGESYQTYRGINFTNLDVTGVTGFNNASAVFYHYGNSTDINFEYCTADNINGTTNNQAYGVWGTVGCKVWRSTSNNIQTSGDNTNQNTAGVFTYSGSAISVQRCEFTNSSSGIYDKRHDAGTISIGLNFNTFKTSWGVRYSISGSSGNAHEYGVAQSNVFIGCSSGGVYHSTVTPTDIGNKVVQANGNVFDNCGGGEVGAIQVYNCADAILFNNIMYNSRKVWANPVDSTTLYDPAFEYANYNHEFGTTLTSQRYEYKAINYTTAAALFTAVGFAANDVESDPTFTNAALEDYTLQAGSPALATGISNTDKGLYLTGNEVIGA